MFCPFYFITNDRVIFYGTITVIIYVRNLEANRESLVRFNQCNFANIEIRKTRPTFSVTLLVGAFHLSAIRTQIRKGKNDTIKLEEISKQRLKK